MVKRFASVGPEVETQGVIKVPQLALGKRAAKVSFFGRVARQTCIHTCLD
jgi:hypothetical protein